MGRRTAPTTGPENRTNTVPRWVAPGFALAAVCTVPWVVFLAASLPATSRVNDRLAWVVFDIGEVVMLAVTAYLAWRGKPKVALAATALGTMLVVDAWFDVNTSTAGAARDMALGFAVLEVTLAGVSLWIAFHAAAVARRRIEDLARREAERELGLREPVALIGYAFSEQFASAHRDALDRFIEVAHRANDIMRQSDQEWEALRPLMKAEDDATFKAYRDRPREGMPRRSIAAEAQDARALFKALADVGGTTLVGPGNNDLTYFLKWESLAEREAKMAKFGADPDWLSARAKTEENGPLVASISNQFLTPTSFSSVK